jgi:DHA1 family tetracycline resistance protein-like MFS transporter
MIPQPDHRGSIAALVGVVLTAMIGFGLFLPVFPFLALHLGATATQTTLAMGAYSLGQLAAAPFWGRLSDRIGRKPILILGLIGAAGSYCFLASAQSVVDMGAARLFGGLMAGNIGAAFAAAGDIADDRTRTRNMGLLSAAFALGFIIGPGIGGFIVSNEPTAESFARVCYVAAAFATAAAVGAAVFFRETRAARSATAGEPLGRIALVRGRPALALLLTVTLVMVTAQALMETTFALWAHAALRFGPHDVGVAFIVLGVASVLIQGGGAGALAKRFGERAMLLGGLIGFAASFAVLPFATSWATLAPALALMAAGGAAASPALQSLISVQTSDDDRGAVMGLNQSASALGRVLGPIISGPLFDLGGHASPFVAGAALLLCAAGIAWSAAPRAVSAPRAEAPASDR